MVNSTIDRLYVLHGGYAVQPDRSVYSPGRWKGEQIILPCNAYLMLRNGEWIMWDTGIDDSLALEPGGRIIAHGLRGLVVRTVAEQLADIGIAAKDVTRVILSHAHFDHVGNAALFQHAVWHVHQREHAEMFGPSFASFGYVPALYECLRRATVELFDGDLDIFGDGSVRILSTPGHTLGHCSLLVRLRETGPILLSADVAHYAWNMEHRAVPGFNADADASRRSMDRLDEIAGETGAQIWLNHDSVRSETQPRAPAFFR